MSGGFLAVNGDVQIGDDTTGLLVRRDTNLSAVGLNPFVAPDYYTEDVGRSDRHGSVSASDVMRVRNIEFKLFVKAASASAFNTAYNGITSILTPLDVGEAELAFMYMGRKYVMFGRYRDVGWEMSSEFHRFNKAMITLKFVATDPLIYDAAETSFSVPINNQTGSVPLYWPLSTSLSIFAGSTPAPATLTFNGNQLARWRYQLVVATGGIIRNPMLVNTVDRTCIGLGNENSSLSVNAYPMTAGQSVYFDAITKRIKSGSITGTDVTNKVLVGSSWALVKSGGAFTIVTRNDATTTATITGHTSTLFYRRGWMSVGV